MVKASFHQLDPGKVLREILPNVKGDLNVVKPAAATPEACHLVYLVLRPAVSGAPATARPELQAARMLPWLFEGIRW